MQAPGSASPFLADILRRVAELDVQRQQLRDRVRVAVARMEQIERARVGTRPTDEHRLALDAEYAALKLDVATLQEPLQKMNYDRFVLAGNVDGPIREDIATGRAAKSSVFNIRQQPAELVASPAFVAGGGRGGRRRHHVVIRTTSSEPHPEATLDTDPPPCT